MPSVAAASSSEGCCKTIYRAAAGAFIAFAVGMQYWLLVRGETVRGVMAASSLKFFSFFTILTNVLAAATLLLPLIAPQSSAGQVPRAPIGAHGGHRLHHHGRAWSITCCCADLSQRQGWPMFFEHMLHYVTPPLFVLDWLAFVPKRDIELARRPQRHGLSARLPRLDAGPRRRDRLVPVSVRRRRRAGLPARAGEHRRTGAGRSSRSRWRWSASVARSSSAAAPRHSARADCASAGVRKDREALTSPRSSRQGCR